VLIERVCVRTARTTTIFGERNSSSNEKKSLINFTDSNPVRKRKAGKSV